MPEDNGGVAKVRSNAAGAVVTPSWRTISDALREARTRDAAALFEEAMGNLDVTMGAGVTLLRRAGEYVGQNFGGEHVDRALDLAPSYVRGAIAEDDVAAKRAALTQIGPDLGRTSADELIPRINRALSELEFAHHTLFDTCALILTYVADNFGEDHIPEMWRHMLGEAGPVADGLAALKPGEQAKLLARLFDAHFSGPTTIREEEDRIVVRHDPCGTGGRMRRDGAFGGKMRMGTTKKAYSWSWGKAGVPYYCIHCCLLWEVDAVKRYGYPLRIHEDVTDFDKPITHLLYKDPARIPSIYYERIGTERAQGRGENA
jgi:hypothetical protein